MNLHGLGINGRVEPSKFTFLCHLLNVVKYRPRSCVLPLQHVHVPKSHDLRSHDSRGHMTQGHMTWCLVAYSHISWHYPGRRRGWSRQSRSWRGQEPRRQHNSRSCTRDSEWVSHFCTFLWSVHPPSLSLSCVATHQLLQPDWRWQTNRLLPVLPGL